MNTRTLAIAEFFKLRKRMMTWVLALLLVGIVVLLYSVLWSISGRSDSFGRGEKFTAAQLRQALFLQASVPFALQIVSMFGTLFAVILAAAAVGSEYGWGTVRSTATVASSRTRMLSARLIVVSGLVAAGTLLAVAVGVAYSTIIMSVTGNFDSSFITGGFVWHQVASYGRTLFAIAPYVAIAFSAAVIGRSTLAGVGAGLGVSFLEPIISNLMRAGGDPWKDIPNYLPSANKQIILLQNSLPAVLRIGPGSDLEGTPVNSVLEASIILSAYIVVAIALAFLAFRRRDITSGGG